MEMKLWKLLMILQKSTIGRFIASIAYNCGFVYIWHFSHTKGIGSIQRKKC